MEFHYLIAINFSLCRINKFYSLDKIKCYITEFTIVCWRLRIKMILKKKKLQSKKLNLLNQIHFIKNILKSYINEHEDDKNLLPTLYKILNQTIRELPSSTISAPVNPLTILQEIKKWIHFIISKTNSTFKHQSDFYWRK